MILILTEKEWNGTVANREFNRTVTEAMWASDIIFVMDKEGICTIVKNRKLFGTLGRISVSDVGYISNEERVNKD